MNTLNNTLKILLSFFIAIFILSFSIAFVILFRPYYYLNVKILDIEQKTGYTYEQITTAYDDVMDFLVLGEEFKTGDLKYTEDGKSHFEDCKKLFVFDFICVGVSFIYILVIFILQKTKKIHLEFKRFSPGIYSLFGIGAFILIFATWGIISFDSLFKAFHLLCFPGKDNWMFNASKDQIVRILPTDLWINFCLLIIFIVLIFTSVIIGLEIKRRKNIKTITE